MKILRKNDKCEYEGCNKKAEILAMGRSKHPDIGKYCEYHAEQIVDEGFPEYNDCCPNCGLLHGIN